MSVMNMDVPSAKTPTLLNIRELYGRDDMNVTSVGEPSAGKQPPPSEHT